MNANNKIGIAATGMVFLFAACNYTDGECFPVEQLYETSGAGGGVIIPTGVGGYGDVPKQPQSAPPEPDGPICNIVSGGPCDEKCQEEYNTASIACAKIEDAASRRACQDQAHVVYKACEDACDVEASRSCKAKYQDCLDFAPFHPCMHDNGVGQTLCQLCRDQCFRREDPTPTCRECRF